MDRPTYPIATRNAQWSVAEAKARFSEVVANAKAGKPQRISRYGRDEVVVVSAESFREPIDAEGADSWLDGSLQDFFEPLRGSGVIIEREPGGGRRAVDFDHPDFHPPEDWPDRPPRIDR